MTTTEAFQVKPYGYDDRINWDTYLIMFDGGVVGFTDSPIHHNNSGETE